jgi:hypothetical protein
MPSAPTRLQPPGRRGLAALGLALAVLALHAALLGWLPRGVGAAGLLPAQRDAAPRMLQVRALPQPAAAGAEGTPEAKPPRAPADAGAGARQARTEAAAPLPTRAAPSPAPAAAPAAPAVPGPAEGPPATDADALTDAAPSPGADSAARPLPAGPPPLTYATRLPPPVILQYAMQRSGAPAPQGLQAQLIWRPEAAAATYTLSLGVGAVGTASVGLLDLHGLAPERHVETRRGRELRAANFQRQPAAEGGGRITFSGPRFEHPLWPGVQDRLSWLLQLPAVVAAEPALGQAGGEVLLLVVGVRGEAAPWVFRVKGTGPLQLPAGEVAAALHLQRTPRHPHDTQVDVWLDPARHHLPVRWRLQHRADAPATEFSLLQMTF